MNIPTEVVAWMFAAVVAIAALAICTNYAIVKLVLTGRALAFERREGSNVVPIHERSQR